MVLDFVLLIIGFVLLIKGADVFVDGASSIAKNFKVSKILIGLTIMAFGTSAPEFAISMNALSNNSTDMVLGNVFGSNVLNTLLILGVAALIHPIKITSNTIRKELPLTLLISTLLVILMLDIKLDNGAVNQFSRSDGLVIIIFFLIFVYYLVSLIRNKKEKSCEEKPKYNLPISLLLVVLGLLGIIFGSNLVVDNATDIAKGLGVSERIIAITIIAFGTSLPELTTSIVSSLKGEQELLLGNIVGSNIFNICIVLGIPVVIFGTITSASFQSIDLVALIISSLLLLIFSTSNKVISRIEGSLLLMMFVVYYFFVFAI